VDALRALLSSPRGRIVAVVALVVVVALARRGSSMATTDTTASDPTATDTSAATIADPGSNAYDGTTDGTATGALSTDALSALGSAWLSGSLPPNVSTTPGSVTTPPPSTPSSSGSAYHAAVQSELRAASSGPGTAQARLDALYAFLGHYHQGHDLLPADLAALQGVAATLRGQVKAQHTAPPQGKPAQKPTPAKPKTGGAR
jgi:hypothetical protein